MDGCLTRGSLVPGTVRDFMEVHSMKSPTVRKLLALKGVCYHHPGGPEVVAQY